jgi:hypothetical protein
MAKKKLDKAMDKEKLDLGQTLYALDARNKKYYSELSDDMKKKYTPLILMRFMSSATNQGGMHEYHLSAVNDVVNQDFWLFSKHHTEFQHLLLSACGYGKKQFHGWIPMAKVKKMDKFREFVDQVHPGINDDEMKLFIMNHNVEDFEALVKSHGYQDDDVEQYVEQFKYAKQGEKE